MTDANYTPPTAAVEDQPAPRAGVRRQGLAILVAFVLDVVGTEVLSAALSVTYFALLGGQLGGQRGGQLGGQPNGSAVARFQDLVSSYDNPWGIAQFIIGSGMSIIGGYLCARIARRVEWRAIGWLCVVHLGYALYRGSPAQWEWWESNAITLGSVLIGAALLRRSLRRAASSVAAPAGASA